MANNQNLTVFQKLTKMFGFPGVAKQQEAPSFNFSKDELLRTNNANEFDKAMLQAQQSSYIADKWAKLDQSLYNQSVYYEPNRLAAYYDFESMEFTPEISAALDIYSEESTTQSEKGDTLTIFSDSDRIKNILDDLFGKKYCKPGSINCRTFAEAFFETPKKLLETFEHYLELFTF